MNHSFYSADRTTHSKIVIVALICATAVAGIAAHSAGDGRAEATHVSVIKASKAATVASASELAVR